MDPNIVVNLAISAADEIITLIKHIKGQSGLTDDQLLTQVESEDRQNLDDIKKLLAL